MLGGLSIETATEQPARGAPLAPSDTLPATMKGALVAARLFAAAGRADRALTAVRRRAPYLPETSYVAPSLGLEAQLAEQLGDSVSAAAVRRELSALSTPTRADTVARGRGGQSRPTSLESSARWW